MIPPQAPQAPQAPQVQINTPPPGPPDPFETELNVPRGTTRHKLKSPGITRSGVKYRALPIVRDIVPYCPIKAKQVTPLPSYQKISSRQFSQVQHITDPNNFIYATLNWENVYKLDDFKRFHDILTRLYDNKTYELVDSDGLHPFCLASKMSSEDFPSYQEIMHLSLEERNKWFDSMDEELSQLYKQGTFKFVQHSEIANQGEDIVKTKWAFGKKCKPSGEVYHYKS